MKPAPPASEVAPFDVPRCENHPVSGRRGPPRGARRCRGGRGLAGTGRRAGSGLHALATGVATGPLSDCMASRQMGRAAGCRSFPLYSDQRPARGASFVQRPAWGASVVEERDRPASSLGPINSDTLSFGASLKHGRAPVAGQSGGL